MAQWLVHWPLDWAVQIQALAWVIILCSLLKHFTPRKWNIWLPSLRCIWSSTLLEPRPISISFDVIFLSLSLYHGCFFYLRVLMMIIVLMLKLLWWHPRTSRTLNVCTITSVLCLEEKDFSLWDLGYVSHTHMSHIYVPLMCHTNTHI